MCLAPGQATGATSATAHAAHSTWAARASAAAHHAGHAAHHFLHAAFLARFLHHLLHLLVLLEQTVQVGHLQASTGGNPALARAVDDIRRAALLGVMELISASSLPSSFSGPGP